MFGKAYIFIPILKESLDLFFKPLIFLFFSSGHVDLEDSHDDVKSSSHCGFQKSVPIYLILDLSLWLLDKLIFIVEDLYRVIFAHIFDQLFIRPFRVFNLFIWDIVRY